MKLIDILILSLSVIGLVYFAVYRIKYSNIDAYNKKLERLQEIRKTIAVIENDKAEQDKIIKSLDVYNIYSDEIFWKLFEYRDNEERLKELKNEQRKIEIYLRTADKYIGKSGI